MVSMMPGRLRRRGAGLRLAGGGALLLALTLFGATAAATEPAGASLPEGTVLWDGALAV
jgi:hypothetical protein